MKTPNPFIAKIYRMLSSDDEQAEAAISWGDWAGQDTVVIKDQAALAMDVLPRYFKHGNVSSFVRQLNMYGFNKTPNSHTLEFHHPLFLKVTDFFLSN